MARKITGYVKLQIPAGQATPAPPVGPALGQHGLNIMDFCKAFNAKTAKTAGAGLPAGREKRGAPPLRGACRSVAHRTRAGPEPERILEAGRPRARRPAPRRS